MKLINKKISKKAILTTLIIFFYLLSFSKSYYVSSSGSDANDGITTSSPWQTITKVNSVLFVAGDQILFRKGDIFYGSIIIKNSGSSGNPIKLGAYGTGANPIISGFSSVNSWTNLGGNIWESTNAVSTLSGCNMVYVNGINTPMGRQPNLDNTISKGYLTYQSSTSTSITSSLMTGTPNWTGAEVILKSSNFSIERRTITSQSGSTINWTTAASRVPENGFGFFIQNDVRTLDLQDEWYYNPTTKKISIYSVSQPVNVKVASVDNLAVINQSYITFDGIDFTGANSYAISNNLTDSPVKEYINIQNCNISFVGKSGISLRATHLTLENNIVIYSNGSGLGASSVSGFVIIRGNTITSTGLFAGMGVGHSAVSSGNYTSNVVIEYNRIIDSGFNGITFHGNNITVKNNFIDSFCKNLDDGGGIYTYTGNEDAMSNVLINGNIIINGFGSPEGTNLVFPAVAAGIYCDNKSKNVEVANNSIYNCRNIGLFLNDSWFLNVHDNTVYGTWETEFGKTSSQFKFNFPTSGLNGGFPNITLNNNIFFSQKINQYCLYIFSYLDLLIPQFGTANNNVYARPLDDNKPIYADQPSEWSGSREAKTLLEWQTFSSQDANSNKSPVSITNENDMQFEYNATLTAKTVSLTRPMIDVKGAKYASSVTLQPYTSVALMKDPNPQTDNLAPVLTAFTIPSTSTSQTISISSYTATDNIGVTGYLLTETSSTPSSNATGWLGIKPTTYIFSSIGSKTLYAWAKDAAGNVSTSLNATITISSSTASVFTFTGPTSGNVNNASSNFTVTPNNSYTGTITITPSGSGSIGLSAKVLSFSNSSASQSFTINTTVAGSIVLTPTNSGSLTNPSALTYTSNAVVPDAPTSIVATAGDANATVTFVAPANNGGSAITGYAVTSIPSGGIDTNAGSISLTHTITGLANGTSYTFTVKAINSAGSSTSSSASNSVLPKAAATGFFFMGPSSGSLNSASGSFTVTPNNAYSGTITITPSGTGSTGLAAKVLSFSNSSASQTFTILPAVAGNIVLTPTNNGSLINPTSLTYTVNAIVPSTPTSVVAVAGNASASVTFVAPNNNGGSVITGYSVTSIPSGGLDINAGSTSLIHTISGLTNGTSYTFTVKATNIAGASSASAASNPVTPSAPIDNSFPVITGFSIPATSTSLTVPISNFVASDNVGVTGYLLAESSTKPSSNDLGWQVAKPGSYTFSSAGLNRIYAWVKDLAGNISLSVMQEVTITLDNKQGQIIPTHFIPVWQGENGLNHMNIIVVSAILEDLPLAANDEVAVFSGSNCVGAAKLSKAISPADNSTFINISASQNDGSNNGFNDNDTIIIKIWDNLNQQEFQAITVLYKSDVSSWLATGKYLGGATSVVEVVSFTVITQTISLLKGYNLVSSNVSAVDPNVSSVTKPLCDQGALVKVQDEVGNTYENWINYGGWTNNIGAMKNTEGYKIEVANDATLQLTGRPIHLPLDIPLKTGWNIISYPRIDLVDAMKIIQLLIDQNKLVKVQDEQGNSIENWGIYGGWKNGIGNFIPGKAYKVKVSSDATLTIQQNYTKSAVTMTYTEKPVYFSAVTEGNGIDHMNINIVGLKGSGISVGDELAAFDGKICVGAIKITDNVLSNQSASLVVSSKSSEKIVDGFNAGDIIDIYAWNQYSGKEIKMQVSVINGELTYSKNSSIFVSMKSLTTGIGDLNDNFRVDIFPNPTRGKVSVRFSELPQAGSRIVIMDVSGRVIQSRPIYDMTEEFNIENQAPGLYLIQTLIGSIKQNYKLIKN